MTAVDFEAEYDNRGRVPEHPEIITGWERDAAAYRRARHDRAELGLAYGPHPRNTIDLFHADTPRAGSAIILLIHGGYWRTFDPSTFSHWAAGMNRRGYSVALPGYRLCPEFTVADIVNDIRDAALHLHRRFAAPLVAVGHSAGGHLAATAVAADWLAVANDAPSNLVRHGLAISGLYDLAPLVQTTVNDQLRLDDASATAVSPAFWPVPAGVMFEARVGGSESSEYLRQARLIAERWSDCGALAHFEEIAGANHFTAPAPLADPGSDLVATLVRLAEAATKG